MAGTSPNSRLNATIINIHSPSDPPNSNEADSHRRTSNASKQHPLSKPSPKVEGYRKYIQVVISKILKRKRPPTALFHLSEICRTAQASDAFENDDTIDLLFQLREMLIVIHREGVGTEVLMNGEHTPTASPVSSRSNSPAASPRSANPSRSTDGIASHIPTAKSEKKSDFETLLQVLGDLVLNDSRYKTANPKPTRPPYIMQTYLIDNALLLVQICDNSNGLFHIGNVFLPAFEAFSDGNMLGKLLSMFLDSLLPKLIKCKDDPLTKTCTKSPYKHSANQSSKFLGKKNSKSIITSFLIPLPTIASTQNKAQKQPNTPTINISSPEPDQTKDHPLKISHLTIDTRAYSTGMDMNVPSSSHSPTAHSTHSNIHYPSNDTHYHAYALFTPLLFFMIQYLDPYLATHQGTKTRKESLIHTLSGQANSVYNFHRALGFMMSCKPDLYLDILDVISHGTADVKFRACQILLYYYFTSVGHIIVADPLPLLGAQEELKILDKRRAEQEFEEMRQNKHHPHQLNGSRQISDSENRSQNDNEDLLFDGDHVWYPHLFEENHRQKMQQHDIKFPFIVHDDTNEAYCKECFKPVQGFGLRCFQCKASVHYNCSNIVTDTEESGIMFYIKSGGIQKVVAPQFCQIPPQPRFRDMVDRGIVGWTAKSNSPKVGLLGHLFYLVNLYTLMTCACCGLPMWGISQQAYRCSECNWFIHPQCLAEAEEKNRFSSKFQTCMPNQPLLESDMQISHTDLSRHLAEFYGDALPLKPESLEGRTFEEVSAILNTLTLQDHILNYGVAAGCIIITHDSDDLLFYTLSQQLDHHSSSSVTNTKDVTSTDSSSTANERHCPSLSVAINLCMEYLNSNKYQGSIFFDDFHTNTFKQQTHLHLLSREEYLSHLCAMMKCLMTSFGNDKAQLSMPVTTNASAPPSSTTDKRRSTGDSRGFLQVSPNPFTSTSPTWGTDEEDDFSEGHMPNENLDRSTLLSWIMTNLNFKSRKMAEILLQHMCNFGLFERFDASPLLFVNDDTTAVVNEEKMVQCIFPVPYAIDCSPNVESLINSIEACLQDVDLSINECGLLMLVRRCWPDPFLSSYSCERLIHAIIAWTFDEDERLLTLHEELTSTNKNSNLRYQRKQQQQHNRWAQAALLSRMKGNPLGTADRNRPNSFFQTATAGVSSGASSIYVTTRIALRDRYIARWMATIHDIDTEAYTNTLFNAIEEIIDDKREECMVPGWDETFDSKKHALQKYEQFIGHIVKLKSNGLTFTSLDALLEKWLDRTHLEFSAMGLLDKEHVDIRQLAKLCSNRTSSLKAPITERNHPIDIIVSQFESGDKVSIDRGMRWLTLVTHSSAGIPSNVLGEIARLIVAARSPLETVAEFIKIVWFQAINIPNVPLPPTTVADVIGYLNEITVDTLSVTNESQSISDQTMYNTHEFIRYSVALACFAYGCPLKHISDLGIVPYVGDHAYNLATSKRTPVQVETSVSMMEVDDKSPLIQCMLQYLRFDQLNLREYVIKLFYAITHWGDGISNKDEFISCCIPQLIPSIWEFLTPTYDAMSSINLNLLMKLISIDVRYFQACVFKIFEDPNWEVRYQGLDHLFGLFTKMDAAFQTEWLKLLSHLGPVFSYFIGCLWDKEEYVRSKAYALIRTFGTLHLRSAFRCWEAYFLTATDRQRMSLVSLMIQLNALFPDWQVLQWESLLESLEMKTPVDILDDYLRSTSMDHDELIIKDDSIHNGSETHPQDEETAESENVKVLMLTLALQMLSNHLTIDPLQISRLKFILVQQMGFQKCQLFNEGGNVCVEFGQLRYNMKDPARVAVMISCIRGLKKVMDSFAPLPEETVATMAADAFEQNKMNLSENSSPGVHFIDVVLKMMNSGVDFTQLGHMTLKAWLEILLIVVYKHNILKREYEQSIVACMKQIVDLLTEDISEENKLLILEILKCLLRCSDHLTAMVLSKQILALGKLMTKLGVRNSEPVYLKAKQFLKSAFLRFAVAGLFVLMFKNQAVSDSQSTDVDLFFVLRTVIDPEDVIPDEDIHGEIVYLRDQPVRDVLDKLMKQQMERKAFSTVLYNTSRYVETVHTHPYSENILNDYVGFIHALIKHTTDWRRSDWNINPMFIMSALLLKEHPYHHAILLPPIQALFRHGLVHCSIRLDAVVKIMAAYSAITSILGVQPNNVFVDIIVDEMKTSFSNSTTKLNKDTLLLLLQLVLWDTKSTGQAWYTKIETSILGEMLPGRERTSYFTSKLLILLPFFVDYMKRVPTSQQFTKKDFKIYSSIAQLIVAMCLKDPKLMVIIFGYLKLEEGGECLRFLNWFILTLLKEQADKLIYDMLEYESVLSELLVRTFNTVEVDFQVPNLNFSYSESNEKLLLSFSLLKSFVLLKLRSGIVEVDHAPSNFQVQNSRMLWMTIWPAIRRLLDMIEPSTLYMSGNVGLSVWDMFLSLLQFLFVSRSETVVINAYEWSDLLNDLLKKINSEDINADFVSHQENGSTDHMISVVDFKSQIEKLIEMFDIPPIKVSASNMINRLFLEMREIMRLQAESVTFQRNNRDLMQAMTSTFN